MADDESVTFEISPFRSLVLPHPLNFPPPGVQFCSNPDGFSYYWQMLTLVADPPNPHRFPPLTNLTDGDRVILTRYVETCEELAGATLINHNGSVTFSSDRDDVVADLPSAEAIRGGVVLFRQVHSDDEIASWNSARKIIGMRVHELRDEHHDQRDEWQRRWRRTRALMLNGLLGAMTDRKGVESEGGHQSVPVPGEDEKPMELLSLFLYGDLIHWGRNREAMRDLAKDDLKYRMSQFNFIETVIQLSHVYIGYAVLVRRALGLPSEVGTHS